MKKVAFLFLILFSFGFGSEYKTIISVAPGLNISKNEINENNILIQNEIKNEIKMAKEQMEQWLSLSAGEEEAVVAFLFSISMDEIFKANIKNIKYNTINNASVVIEFEVIKEVDSDFYKNIELKLGGKLDLEDKKNREKFKEIFIKEIKKVKRENIIQEFEFEKKNGKWESKDSIFDF